MRIACLQFAPQVGDVDNNLNRADAVLSKANPQNLDLLVLPELAFSGYNFKSLQHISPYLEPTTSGITSLWARTTALKYDCVVTVGYPEKVDVTPKWPASPEYYNSAITVNADGETIANYRKSFLYYTDETWALEGPDGFFYGDIEGLGNVAMGICKWPTKSFKRMDLNPYKFEAPWSAWEFAYHVLHKEANLVVLSMAWLTREDARSYSRCPKEPDMETLSYWLARMEPLIRAETEGEIICVFANRSGTEDEAVYAGTSAVLGIHSGEVKVYGILGRGEKELLVVDTSKRPQAKLVSEPSSTASDHKNIPIDVRHGENDARKSTIDSSAESSADASTDVRTNSAVSSRSDLSLNTNVTACTIPDFSDACFPKSLEDVITPLSPVDANSPSAFFAPRSRRPEGETFIENLRSSIGQKIQQQHQTPLPDSPTFQQPSPPGSRNASRVRQQEHQESNSPARAGTPAHVRPASPKSRNASRTRMLEYQEPTGPARAGTPAHVRPASPKSRNASRTRMLEYQEPTGPARAGTPAHVRPASPKSRNASRTRTLEYQEPALLYHDLAKVEQRTSSPATVRPSSRNYSSNRHREYQEPAPVSHDPAKEEQIKKRAIGITSPVQPRSAASAPDQSDSAYSPRLTGTRRSSSLSRPRSAIW